MIDILPDLIGIIGAVPSVGGRVYRQYPQTKAKPPYVVIDRVGRSTVQVDHDGSEVAVLLSYQVDILASSPSALDSIQSDITDALASYNIHPTGESPMWESNQHLYRRSVTLEGVVDRRGNTFTS